jgi:hypothetical protein
MISFQVETLFRRPFNLSAGNYYIPDAKDSLGQRRLLIVISTIALNIIAVWLLTFVSWSDWRTGVALNFIDNAILLWFVVKHGDRLLARFMLFGLAVGVAELAADAWLVDYTKTLDYSIGGGPILWRSPSGCRLPGKSWLCNLGMSDCGCGIDSAAMD